MIISIPDVLPGRIFRATRSDGVDICLDDRVKVAYLDAFLVEALDRVEQKVEDSHCQTKCRQRCDHWIGHPAAGSQCVGKQVRDRALSLDLRCSVRWLSALLILTLASLFLEFEHKLVSKSSDSEHVQQ